MSNWLNFGHDNQRTCTDPDGNITSIAEVWKKDAGTNPLYGWAGGAIADSSSVYHFYSSYGLFTGGVGDCTSINKYNRDGQLQWSVPKLGGHDNRGVWPAVVGDNIYYHDYAFQRLNIFTGGNAGAYRGADTYGNMVFNTAQDKMFSSRVASNEGFQGWIWVKGFDLTIAPGPLHSEVLWTRLEADETSHAGDAGSLSGAIVYDNSKIYYAPKYTVWGTGTWTNPAGIYCWNEAGVQQWFVAGDPLGYMSAGDNRLYVAEGAAFSPNSVLKAFSQTDGSTLWSAVIPGIYGLGQPPVVVGSLVIVTSDTMGVRAFNSTTGAIVWTAALAGVLPFNGNVNAAYTTIAAAGTSNTLVVTTQTGIYILDLADGSVVQFYDPPSLEGRPINPIIVDNRLYVSDLLNDLGFSYFPQVILCLENGATPPPSDAIPPSTPGNPTFSGITPSTITASWTGSTDNIAVVYYNLFYRQSGSATWNSTIKTTLSHTFTGLSQNTTYQFYVNAVDAAGNVSSNSATTSQATSAITVDTNVPSAPGTPTFTNVTGTSLTVSWTPSSDDVAISSYRVYWKPAGGSYTVADKTTTSHNITGLISGITYEFFVVAYDTSGNRSPDSTHAFQTTTVVVSDTTPPTTPGNPTFSSVTSSSMTVSWSASTDASGVSSYTLFYRQLNGTWITVTTTSTSRSFTGLSPNTTYEFYVKSTDIYGNQSANSATTSQLTPDVPVTLTTQISGTTSLSATGQKTTHNLNWQNVDATMELQRKTGKTSFVTIYTGSAPYSYIQDDLKAVYYYRILLNGTIPSNTIQLKSARK